MQAFGLSPQVQIHPLILCFTLSSSRFWALHWLNVAVRLAGTKELIGRLEATVHNNLAEVAFLYSPAHWGHGYASHGLNWLIDHLRSYKNISSLWATTHPKNARSAALLLKCGYVQVATPGLPVLYSYDDGDLVFRRSAPQSPRENKE